MERRKKEQNLIAHTTKTVSIANEERAKKKQPVASCFQFDVRMEEIVSTNTNELFSGPHNTRTHTSDTQKNTKHANQNK